MEFCCGLARTLRHRRGRGVAGAIPQAGTAHGKQGKTTAERARSLVAGLSNAQQAPQGASAGETSGRRTRPSFGGALMDTLAVALVLFQTRAHKVSLLFEFAVLFRSKKMDLPRQPVPHSLNFVFLGVQ